MPVFIMFEGLDPPVLTHLLLFIPFVCINWSKQVYSEARLSECVRTDRGNTAWDLAESGTVKDGGINKVN